VCVCDLLIFLQDTGLWVLTLNREVLFSQLLADAVPADASGSWLLGARLKPRAEEVLGAQRRKLWRLEQPGASVRNGLYTILPLPLLYGGWHTKGWSGGGVVYCAIDVQ